MFRAWMLNPTSTPSLTQKHKLATLRIVAEDERNPCVQHLRMAYRERRADQEELHGGICSDGEGYTVVTWEPQG